MRNYWKFFNTHPRSLAFGFTHSFFSSFGQTFFIAFYGAYLLDEFQLTSTAYGAVYSSVTLLSSLSLSYFGELMDRFSYRILSFLVALGMAITSFSFYFVESLYGLALVLFFLRLFGQGFSPLISNTVMAKVFNKYRGKALAIAGLGHPIGEALLPLLLIQPSIALLGWRESWLVIGIFIALIFPFISLHFSKNLKGEINFKKADPNQRKLSRYKLFKDKRFFLIIPTAVMNAFTLTAIFFHFSYVMDEKSWSPAIIASGFVVFGISRAIFSLVSGDLIDRYSTFLLLKFYLIPILLGVTTLMIPSNHWGLFAFFFLCGISVGFSNNLFTAIWAEIFGTEYLGAIRGLAGTCAVISTAIGPPLIGWMIDHNYSVSNISLFLLAAIFLAYSLIFFHPQRKKS